MGSEMCIRDRVCPCGKARDGRTGVVGECELYMEERDVLKRKMNEYNLEKFGTLVDNGKKTISILGDR